MSERGDFKQEKLLHDSTDSYEIEDLYEYGMDVLKQKGQDEYTKTIGDHIATSWGGSTTRFRCTMFAKEINERSALYVYAQDWSGNTCVYSLNAPVNVDGMPVEPYIQTLVNDTEVVTYCGDEAGQAKSVLVEIMNESGLDGPTLTKEGRDRFWDIIASTALDDSKVDNLLEIYVKMLAEGARGDVEDVIKSRIAAMAVSKIIKLDSGGDGLIHSSTPIRYIDRQIERRALEIIDQL